MINTGMAKTSLPVILSAFNPRTGVVEDVCACPSIWAVHCSSTPISIRTTSKVTGLVKYKKSTFTCVGHAQRLANRLNLQFKTTDFHVVEIFGGS